MFIFARKLNFPFIEMWGSGDIFSREPCDIPYKYNEKKTTIIATDTLLTFTPYQVLRPTQVKLKKNINCCYPTKVNVTKGKLGLQRKMPLRFQIKV